MPPLPRSGLKTSVTVHRANTYGDWRDVNNPEAFITEAWGEGFMLGALLIMAVNTTANMRKGVLLHKLIFIELLLAMSHGTFCFMAFHGYGWYLSSTAALLYCSYFTHNVVAWLKIAPFFSGPQPSFRPTTCKFVKWIYLPTLALSGPVTIFEIFNNFRYFNNIDTMYYRVRPYEPLMRDPWWLFSCTTLFYVISKCYNIRIWRMVRRAPRFGILLGAIFLAMAFTTMDILASIIKSLSQTDGINPYWKLALVFKCLTDNIMLDDFKAVLQRLGAMRLDGTTAMAARTVRALAPPSVVSNGVGGLRISLSGRVLDDGESLDGDGASRRRQSILTSTVGKLGIKVRRLPLIPSSESGGEKEARRNAERNRHIPDPKLPEDIPTSASSVGTRDTPEHSPRCREPWEEVDFITALNDPDVKRRY